MKISKALKKETLYIIIGQIILLSLLMAIYFIIKRFYMLVLYGGIAGSLLAVGNFFLMGIEVSNTFHLPNARRLKILRISQTGRLLSVALIVVICLCIPKFDPTSTVISLVLPRVTIFIRQFFIKR